MALFKVLLVDSAVLWFDGLPATSTNTWANMKAAFETRYNPPGFMKYQYANDLFNTKQGDSSVDDFYAKIQILGREVNASEEMLRFAVINGLKPDILPTHVTHIQPTTWNNLVHHAKIGEMCSPVAPPSDPTLAVKLKAIRDQLKQRTTTKTVPSTSPVCFAGRQDSRFRGNSPQASTVRHVRFDQSADRGIQEYRNTDGGQREERRSRSSGRHDWDADSNRESRVRTDDVGLEGVGFPDARVHRILAYPQNFGPQSYGQGYGPPLNYGQMENYGQTPNYGQNFVPQPMPMSQPAYAPPPPVETGWNAGQGTGFTPITMQCGKCGHAPHSHPNMCPAVNDNCRGCSRKGHFVRVCRTTARQQQQSQ